VILEQYLDIQEVQERRGMMTTNISSLGTLCIELHKEISLMGKKRLGKNHEERCNIYGKREFENNHGK